MSSMLILDFEGIYREAVPIPDAVCSPVGLLYFSLNSM